MKCQPFVLSIALLFITLAAFAEEAKQKSEEREKTVKATYLITGLHCPPCTRTVESSLQRVKGIRSIKVDWKSKDARIEFDEARLPAQKVAQLIADTPHMMGRNMHYDGLLLLKVADIKSLSQNRWGLAHFAESSEQNVPVPLSADGSGIGSKDEGTAKPTQEALSKVKGVKRVVAYPAQHSVGIEFDAKGKLTSQELVAALADAGIKATTL